MTWIVLSVTAAAFQTLRFMLQKSLSMGSLSAGGATLARFVYATPFVWMVLAAAFAWTGTGWPVLDGRFWPYVLIGGLGQVMATWAVVTLFSQRNFAVGITFKKTEVMQAAIVGLAVLGDRITAGGLAAIAIGLAGVLVLSDTGAGKDGEAGWRRVVNRAAGLGLFSGASFAVSAVAYRGATLAVGADDALIRGVVALASVTTTQVIYLGLWLGWREPGELGRIWAARGRAVWMGLTSMAGSVCWFTAFALMNAAYVFAVGQVEVIMSIAATVLVFGETVSRREYLGIGLVTASILGLVLLG